jgi:hypothetical protein
MSAIFTALRLDHDGRSSIARWQDGAGGLLCYCLEPGPEGQPHPWIPPGTYPLRLRTVGEKHAEYARYYGNKFGIGWHKGMIEIADVPGRLAIEFHVGNTIADTLGCSLAGSNFLAPPGNGSEHYETVKSRDAYERVYPVLRDAVLAGAAQLIVQGEVV